MRILLIKILLRLLSDNSYSKAKDEVVQEWLASLASENSAYKRYYSIRKQAILGVMSVGIAQKEYWVNLGRIAELKQINNLSSDALKKKDKVIKK